MAAIEIVITAAPFFILQLLLLKNTNKLVLRLIPAYILLLGAVAALLLYGGASMSSQLLGIGMMIALAFYAVAVLLAWAVWGIAIKIKKNKH